MRSIALALLGFGLFLGLASNSYAGTSANLVTNPSFSGGVAPTNWTSGIGWQACAGFTGSQPCVNGSNQVIFAYIPTTVSQAGIVLPVQPVGVSPSAIKYTISHEGGYFNDASQITLQIYNASNNRLASQSATCSSPCTDSSLSVSITDPAVLAAARTATVSFADMSGNRWAGNYGAVFSNPSLVVTTVDPVPTLGGWALIVLTVLMALIATILLPRKQRFKHA